MVARMTRVARVARMAWVTNMARPVFDLDKGFALKPVTTPHD